MAYKGKFNPSNPGKYMGDYHKIVYRSSWECRVMFWLDKNPDIIQWASEEIIIPYVSPVDNRVHRYFPDFLVKYRTHENKIKTMLIEIKPEKQTKAPKGKRKTKQLMEAIATFGVNQAKWAAANEYCLDRGWVFRVLTEKDLKL